MSKEDSGNSWITMNDLSHPAREYWGSASQNRSELKYMYALGILNMEDWSEVTVPGADPAERGMPFFQFRTPPQSYEIVENAATVVMATQDGGKFIESQGNIFKEIRITGTVGLRPGEVSRIPIISLLPRAFGGADERGLDPEEITGHDDIIFLRNIFRGYWNYKKDNELGRKIIMYWMYSKEDEFYVVEPISFTTSRDSSNPLSWNYSIALRTLYRLDIALSYVRDPLSTWDKIGNAVALVKQAAKDITQAVIQIANAIDFITNLPGSIVSLAMSIPMDIASSVLNSAGKVLQSLQSFKETGKRLTDQWKSDLKNLVNEAKKLEGYARQLHYGKKRGDRRAFGGINVLINTGFGFTVMPSDMAALACHKDPVIFAAKLLQRTSKRLQTLDSLFIQPKQVVVENYAKHYNEGGTKSPFSFSPLDPHNISIPPSAYEAEVKKDDDIRSLAKQYLNDEAQWKKLAIVNNLKSPYIGPVRADGVLAPGDKILIPKQATGDTSSVMQPLNTDSDMESQTPIQRKYGRDLKLRDSGADGVSLADIEIGQNGDLALIDGLPNVNQAMMIKFSTEQGELPTHPVFGARFPIGSKLTAQKFNEFMVGTRRTVLQDPRISRIKKLKTFIKGDVITTSVTAELKDSNIELPIDISVRRT